MPNEDFSAQAQRVVGPTLSDRGFTLDEIDHAVDEGGRYGAALYFRGPGCKVQIYWSAREMEISAMITPPDAPNEHGLYDHSKKWHYLNSFTPMPDITLEDLAKEQHKEQVTTEHETDRLQRLSSRIERYYEDAHAGIAKLYD